jgi:hypothetical protein
MMPRLAGHASLDGSIIGAEAPSRTTCSSGSVLSSVCAPPSVRAVPVTRATASPTRYFTRYSAARGSRRPPLRVAQPCGFHVIPRRLWRLLPYPVPVRCDPGGAVLDDVVGHVRLEGCQVDQWATSPPVPWGPGADLLYRLTLTILPQEGDALVMQATAFVPEQQEEESSSDLPSILGLYGCLERLRFAVARAWRPSFSVLPEPRYMLAGSPEGPMADRTCALSSTDSYVTLFQYLLLCVRECPSDEGIAAL